MLMLNLKKSFFAPAAVDSYTDSEEYATQRAKRNKTVTNLNSEEQKKVNISFLI